MVQALMKSNSIEQRTSFYKALFEDTNKRIEVRVISNDIGIIRREFFTFNELMSYEPPTDKNVYVGIFERKGKGKGGIKDCIRTRALWADFDDMELDEINYRIEMSGLPLPSMIVNSGHGYHVYWLLDKPAGHEVKPILNAITKKLKADPKSKDIARILRIPGTNNMKSDPVPCELLQPDNGNRSPLKLFETVLGVKAQVDNKERTGAIRELLNITFNGIHNMAAGVSKGERNFCTGRIVQTLKRLNFTKQEVKGILFRWNELNSPSKNEKELKKDIETFWHKEELRFAGKDFSDKHLQELNEKFIDSHTTFFKPDEVESHHYDNELLKPEVFQSISGLTFAILSTIKLAEGEGIRREHIADLCDRNAYDKKLLGSLKFLEKMKYIQIKKKGRTNFYYFAEKANYKRGFTAVPKLLHRLFIKKDLTEPEYKLLILLESFAFDNKKEVYPGNPQLSYRTGQTERNIRNILKRLEHKQYIKMEIKEGRRYIRMIYR